MKCLKKAKWEGISTWDFPELQEEDSSDFTFLWEFFKWIDSVFSDSVIAKIIENFSVESNYAILTLLEIMK